MGVRTPKTEETSMSSHSTAPSACAAALALLALCGPAAGQDLRVTAGTIEDRRTTGKFFGGLEIELKASARMEESNGARHSGSPTHRTQIVAIHPLSKLVLVKL